MTSSELNSKISRTFWSLATARGGDLTGEAHDAASYLASVTADYAKDEHGNAKTTQDPNSFVKQYRHALNSVADSGPAFQSVFLDLKGDEAFEDFVRQSKNLPRIMSVVSAFAMSDEAKSAGLLASSLINAMPGRAAGGPVVIGEDSFQPAEINKILRRVMFRRGVGMSEITNPREQALMGFANTLADKWEAEAGGDAVAAERAELGRMAEDETLDLPTRRLAELASTERTDLEAYSDPTSRTLGVLGAGLKGEFGTGAIADGVSAALQTGILEAKDDAAAAELKELLKHGMHVPAKSGGTGLIPGATLEQEIANVLETSPQDYRVSRAMQELGPVFESIRGQKPMIVRLAKERFTGSAGGGLDLLSEAGWQKFVRTMRRWPTREEIETQVREFYQSGGRVDVDSRVLKSFRVPVSSIMPDEDKFVDWYLDTYFADGDPRKPDLSLRWGPALLSSRLPLRSIALHAFRLPVALDPEDMLQRGLIKVVKSGDGVKLVAAEPSAVAKSTRFVIQVGGETINAANSTVYTKAVISRLKAVDEGQATDALLKQKDAADRIRARQQVSNEQWSALVDKAKTRSDRARAGAGEPDAIAKGHFLQAVGSIRRSDDMVRAGKWLVSPSAKDEAQIARRAKRLDMELQQAEILLKRAQAEGDNKELDRQVKIASKLYEEAVKLAKAESDLTGALPTAQLDEMASLLRSLGKLPQPTQ